MNDASEVTHGALFAAWIKAHRTALGLTQASLARRLGVAQGTVATWEQASNRPEVHRVAAIAAALSADEDEAWEMWHAGRRDEQLPPLPPPPPTTHELVVEVLEKVAQLIDEVAQLRAEIAEQPPPASQPRRRA